MAESQAEHLKCSGCDRTVADLDLLIRIKDDIALCDECVEVAAACVSVEKAKRLIQEAEERYCAASEALEVAQTKEAECS